MPFDLSSFRQANPQFDAMDSYDLAQKVYESNPELSKNGVSFEDFAEQIGTRQDHANRTSGLSEASRAVGEGISALPRNIAASAVSAYQGGDVSTEDSWSNRFLKESETKNREFLSRYSKSDIDSFAGITPKDVSEGMSSLGFSGVSALGGIGAGIAGEAIPIPGSGLATGAATAGKLAYNMARNQITRSYLDSVNEYRAENGFGPIDEQGWQNLKANFDQKAHEYGLWEALPEAIGSAIGFKLLTAPLKGMVPSRIANKMLGKMAMGAGRFAGTFGEELATETMTQVGQGGIEAELGMRDHAPTVGEAFKEVYGPTAVMTGVMGGGTKIGHMAYSHLKPISNNSPTDLLNDQPEQVAPPLAIENPSEQQPVQAEQISALNNDLLNPRVAPSRTVTSEDPNAIGGPIVKSEQLYMMDPIDAPPTHYMELTQPGQGRQFTNRPSTYHQNVDPISVEREMMRDNLVPTPHERAIDARSAQLERQRLSLQNGPTMAGEPEGDRLVPLSPILKPFGVIDQKANEAATSPTNKTLEPTEKQQKAGNYKKGHIKLDGLDISIENPAGSTRSGKDSDGETWQTDMQHHYGYLKGTLGRDKDHLDVFIKPGTETSPKVYVVDQVDPKTGKMDEHKILIGFDSEIEAAQAYQSNYDKDWNGGAGITKMSMDEFKKWAFDGKRKVKPLSDLPFAPKAEVEQDVPTGEVAQAGQDSLANESPQQNMAGAVEYEMDGVKRKKPSRPTSKENLTVDVKEQPSTLDVGESDVKKGPASEKPLTKREKFLKKYNDYVSSLSEEDINRAGDLIEDSPKFPSGALLKIQKKLKEPVKTESKQVKQGETGKKSDVGKDSKTIFIEAISKQNHARGPGSKLYEVVTGAYGQYRVQYYKDGKKKRLGREYDTVEEARAKAVSDAFKPVPELYKNLSRGTIAGGVKEIGELHDDVVGKKKTGNVKKAVRFQVVGKEEAKKLKKNTGLDLEGYKHTIDNFGIQHTYKKHGDLKAEKKRGQIPVKKEDFLKIPEIISSYDEVTHAGRDDENNDVIRFKKRVNGYIYFTEAVRTGRHELVLKSLWKTHTATRATSEEGVAQTSETLRSNLPKDSKGIISKAGGDVNKGQSTDEKYSTRPSTGKNITIKDVQSLFPGQAVGLFPNGSIWVRTSNGRGLIISNVDSISEDSASFQVAYGRMKESGEMITGKYENGKIEISKAGDKWTLLHENSHFLEDSGIINKREVNILKNHIKILSEKGKFTPENKNDIGGAEDRANFIADHLYAKNKFGKVRKILDKIVDFLDRLMNVFGRTTRGILRDIKSGEIYNRKVNGKNVKVKIPSYEKSAGRWYSQMEQFLSEKLPGKSFGKTMADMVQSWASKGQIKQEELEWSGLLDWLRGHKSVTKQEVLDWLSENNVRVEEVVKGETNKYDADTAETFQTKDDSGKDVLRMQISGYDEVYGLSWDEGKNFDMFEDGEFVTSLNGEDAEQWIFETTDNLKNSEDSTKYSQYQLPGGENYKELLFTIHKPGDIYRSPHWNEPNVLAHIRFNERADAEGNKVLFIEEIQSDWHQAGRKTWYNKKIDDMSKEELLKAMENFSEFRGDPYLKELSKEQLLNELKNENGLGPIKYDQYIKQIEGKGVPNAPFKKYWPLMAFKRIVRNAAENGFDKVAWTQGEVQIERYGQAVGEQADRIEHGMGEFYDKILPNVANKFFNKSAWGKAKVNSTKFDFGEAWSIPITPEMKSKATREGMPLFSTKAAKQFDKEMPGMLKDAYHIISGLNKDFKETGKEDTTILSRVLGSPEFWKQPTLKRLFEAAMKRPDNYYNNLHGMTHSTDGKSLIKRIEDFQKQRKDEYAKLTKLILDNDRKKIFGYTVDEIEENRFKVTRKKDKKEIGIFPTEQIAWQMAYHYTADQYIKTGELSEQGADAWLAYREMMDNGLDKLQQDMKDAIEKYEKAGMDLPEIAVRTDEGELKIDLRQALREMGKMRGYYAPRIRRPGKYKLLATKNGSDPIIEFFDTKFFLSAKANKLRKQGYTVQKDLSGKMSEDVFEIAGKTIGTQALINQVLGKVGGGGKKSLDDIGIKTKWGEKENGDKIFIVRTSFPKKEYIPVFESLGGKFRERGAMGVEYSPQWEFDDAPANIEEAISKKIFEIEGVQPDTDLLFATELAIQTANLFKGRGFRGSMIKRNDKIYLGYEEDPLINSVKYASGISAGLAKKEMAIDLVKISTGTDIEWNEFKAGEGKEKSDKIEALQKEIKKLPKNAKAERRTKRLELKELREELHKDYQTLMADRRLDPARQPNAFRESRVFIEDMLRNDEAIDRMMGTIKGVAVLKYLAGRVSAPLVNLTALVTSVPAAMHGYAGISLKKAPVLIGKASTLYGKHRFGNKELINSDIRKAFEYIEEQGWHKAQYNKEAVSVLQSRLGRGYSNAVEYGMLMFGATEQLNRVSTIAGAYIGIKEQHKGEWTDADRIAALEKAKHVSDRAHGTYGKESLPHWARGKDIGGQVARSWYVFRKFSHNYMQTMYELGFKEKDAKAALFMAVSPAILAGAGASVITPLISGILKAFGADDPEEDFYRFLNETFGETAENYGRFGLFGFGGSGVSLKGSLAVGVGDLPTTLSDVLGAPGSVISDIWEGGKNILRGDAWKGTERIVPLAIGNAMKAIREHDEGVTTRTNAPIFYGNEQLKADNIDATMRFLSFNPARMAGIREKQWKEKITESKYTEKRADIYAKFKRYFLKPASDRSKSEYIDMLNEIREYNQTVTAKGYNIPLITSKSLKTNLKKAFRPSKKERERAI